MEIQLQQLRDIVNRLFDHLITTKQVDKVELGADLYWDVPEERRYVGSTQPQPDDLDVGDLEDDWEFVSSLLNKDTDPVAYQLTEVAPLLRRVGEVLAKSGC